jgi:cardiolipin synthase
MTGGYRSGNRISLLASGGEYFPALIAAIDAAHSEVRLETYIYEDDATGRKIADALIRAAQRGVGVHVVVDGFGSPAFMDSIGKPMQAHGVEVYVYRPELSPFRFKRYRLRRMHRKLACIDARIAFVGGIISLTTSIRRICRNRVSTTPYKWKGRCCSTFTAPW